MAAKSDPSQTGCFVPPGTPVANLRAMVEAAEAQAKTLTLSVC